MDSRSPTIGVTVEPSSLEAKYSIVNRLDRLPTGAAELEDWLVKEFKTRKSRWGDEKIHFPPNGYDYECTIRRDRIDDATRDPARRAIGYLFEKCGRADDFQAWFDERISVSEFRSFSVGGFGPQFLHYTEPGGRKQNIGNACYVWPNGGLSDDAQRDPQAVAKNDFVVDRKGEHEFGLGNLSVELFQNVVTPLLQAQADAVLRVDAGKHAGRAVEGAGGGGEFPGGSAKSLSRSGLTF